MIEIPKDVRDEMVAQALREYPNEACGLLAGTVRERSPLAAVVARLLPMRNADASPASYRLDPREQLEVFDRMDAEGWDLAGIYHSHTHSQAYPSETDRSLAFYPDAHYVLVSLQDRQAPVVRGYTIRDGVIEEQEVSIV